MGTQTGSERALLKLRVYPDWARSDDPLEIGIDTVQCDTLASKAASSSRTGKVVNESRGGPRTGQEQMGRGLKRWLRTLQVLACRQERYGFSSQEALIEEPRPRQLGRLLCMGNSSRQSPLVLGYF